MDDRFESKTIRVWFLISEADPLIKVGGLGDVGGSLPPKLISLSPDLIQGYKLDVRLVLPFHSNLQEKLGRLEPLIHFSLPHKHGGVNVQTFQLINNNLSIYLIDGPPIRNLPNVYGDDQQGMGEKYVFFSLAALQLAKELNWQPDILHAHDWHAATAVYAMKTFWQKDPFYAKTKALLTIHNLPFMGAGAEKAITDYGLMASSDSGLPKWARKLPLPIALCTADHINAVSKTYAKEILTPEFGCGLETYLLSRKSIISGIVNGVDVVSWDPSLDRSLAANFNLDNLASRSQNKDKLLKDFNLNTDSRIPLLTLIGRLDQQKGVDLGIQALKEMGSVPWQAIILGTGNKMLEDACRNLEIDFPDRVRAVLRFDAQLSRQLYGGADILIMPSRYEPCGLAQMIAMRYGCIPVVRSTGGLKDTIHDTRSGNGTGFLFKTASVRSLKNCLNNALKLYQDQQTWQKLQVRAMNQDFSWEKSALAYANLYLNLGKSQH